MERAGDERDAEGWWERYWGDEGGEVERVKQGERGKRENRCGKRKRKRNVRRGKDKESDKAERMEIEDGRHKG